MNPHVKELLRQCFVQFRCQLVEEKLIEEEDIFIDGTKIEANANKFTFVWRKSIEKFSAQLVGKSNQSYEELLNKEIIPSIEREDPDSLTVEEMTQVVERLDDEVQKYDRKIDTSNDVTESKQLRAARKETKLYRKQFEDFAMRTQKYQNGQLKPGYNVQLATEGQFALAYDVFPNPTDTRTFIPFLDKIEQDFFSLPNYIVADAGYGSEPNYNDVVENRNRTPLITYNQYRKEKQKKNKQDLFNVDNWEYNAIEDCFTCPNNQTLSFSHLSYKKDKDGFTRTYRVYECDDCSLCPLRSQCTKAKEGNNRKIFYIERWEQQKAYAKQLLSEKETGKIYGRRKIDVEPVFGFLKANLRFTRFSVRGKEKVKNELGFAIMAMNMRKYTARKVFYRIKIQKKDPRHQKSVTRIFFQMYSASYVPASFNANHAR